MFSSLNTTRIENALKIKPTEGEFNSVLRKTHAMERLTLEEVAILLNGSDSSTDQSLFSQAQSIKTTIYGKRLVLFAPLYISNECINDCTYCGFRVSNCQIARKRLSFEEIRQETQLLLDSGQKRTLLVAGESNSKEEFEYILKAIETVYGVEDGKGGIRRLNVNIAPVNEPEFKELKKADIGTYQIFQETYHQPTYKTVHPSGPKSDYGYRLDTIDRAFKAGIDDVGIGVLFGLYDYRWEILALMDHIEHLEKNFGMGPHTISIPRIEPAEGCDIATNPPFPVSDEEFFRIIAILRLAVPYTGIILSTRETKAIRAKAFDLGISQISAGSRTNPGGYSEDSSLKQFSLGDHRPLDEVVRDIIEHGYIPSFCTSCYRLGRTGLDFMDLAKPGEIAEKCGPNALITLQEYLDDYGSEKTKQVGYDLLKKEMGNFTCGVGAKVKSLISRVEHGERDLFI
jgi:2-iminoacetate synthase